MSDDERTDAELATVSLLTDTTADDPESAPNGRTSVDDDTTKTTTPEPSATPLTVRAEFVRLWPLWWPMCITFLTTQLTGIWGLSMVGRLGAEELASLALAVSSINIVFTAPSIGLLSAMDPLCSQAYGAKLYTHVGLVFQRGVIIGSIFWLLCALLLVWARPILLLVGQSEAVASKTALAIHILLPGYLPGTWFEASKRFLQAQGKTTAIGVIAVLALICNCALQPLFIWGLKLGFAGAALGQALSLALLPLMMWVYLQWSRAHDLTWSGWSWAALRGWIPFMKIGLPSLLWVTAEWMAFELTLMFAGWISDEALAAHSVVISVGAFLYMFPAATGVAVATRVGNELGANAPRAAQWATRVGLCFTVCLQIALGLVIFSLRSFIPAIFTTDEKVIQISSKLLPYLSLFTIFDAICAVTNGVLRGAGRPVVGAILAISAYWVVALPLTLVMMFVVHLGVGGIWVGFSTAQTGLGIVLVLIVWRQDWKKLADEAAVRLKDEPAAEQVMAALGISVSNTSAELIGVELDDLAPTSSDRSTTDGFAPLRSHDEMHSSADDNDRTLGVVIDQPTSRHSADAEAAVVSPQR